MSGVGGQPSPVEVLREMTLAPLKSLQAQERPERGGKSKGRALRQVICSVCRHVLFCFFAPRQESEGERSVVKVSYLGIGRWSLLLLPASVGFHPGCVQDWVIMIMN